MLVSRIEEEIGAGLKTGLIRGMGVTGPVVTAAGVVFAVTMGTMITSDLRAIGQFGTTIGIGLLFDTFVVRSLITPSIMTAKKNAQRAGFCLSAARRAASSA